MVTGADRASKRSVLARYPDFRRLFIANSVSLLGSSVTTVALPLTAVVYLHASPVQMGFLGAVALLPHLVLGLPTGVWVDRLPYKRILVLADPAQAALLGSIPVLAAFGSLRIWHLYVVVVLGAVAVRGRHRDRLPLPAPFVARAARRARQGMTCPPAVTAEPTGRLAA